MGIYVTVLRSLTQFTPEIVGDCRTCTTDGIEVVVWPCEESFGFLPAWVDDEATPPRIGMRSPRPEKSPEMLYDLLANDHHSEDDATDEREETVPKDPTTIADVQRIQTVRCQPESDGPENASEK